MARAGANAKRARIGAALRFIGGQPYFRSAPAIVSNGRAALTAIAVRSDRLDGRAFQVHRVAAFAARNRTEDRIGDEMLRDVAARPAPGHRPHHAFRCHV
jgi:hypothetical protein